MDKKHKNRKGLKSKEKLFCFYFVNSLDIEESAKKAGYKKDPLINGQKLLQREDVVSCIKDKLSLQKELYSSLAGAGFVKLAFSSVADAVSLVFSENPSREQLENMNLFMVSEIRKPRDGALEIKFFDKIKVLEKLCSDSDNNDGSDMGLVGALSLGAKNLSVDLDGDECGV